VTLLPHRTPTPQCVFVEFEAGLQIRIPLDSTNLRYSTPARRPLKLSYLSVQHLIALAQEWETLCSSTSKECGTPFPSVSGKKSSKN
jgi:hypothetical protein